MSGKNLKILILGGSGFVGGHLIARLARDHHKITVLSRRPQRCRHLKVIPDLSLIAADCHDPNTLLTHCEGQDVVINLVGILNEKGDRGKGFRHAHVELTEKVVQACKQTGVHRLLHMSALNANASAGPSHYLQTKGEAEEIAHTAADDSFHVTSFQPSVIFGPGDSFFNRFAGILRMTPGILTLACPRARMAPVYVGDVVEAFVQCLEDRNSFSMHYTLCGPRAYTLKQLVQYTAKVIGKKCVVIGLGRFLSRIMARMLEFMPGQPMSRDNYRSLQVDSVCENNGLDILGIMPRGLDAIVPSYLADRTSKSLYDEYRRTPR